MPLDTTPRGDEMVRRLPERKFPDPRRPGDKEDAELGSTPLAPESSTGGDSAEASDVARRPSLPDHPVRMPADDGADE